MKRRLTIRLALAVLIFGLFSIHKKDAGSAGEFRSAQPGYQFHFPFDHGSHDDFQTEWWYYTGHLRDGKGRTFGYQVTFFRRAVTPNGAARNPSRWTVQHIYFAHFALTDEGKGAFRFAEKISRAGIGKAGARTGTLDVWIDDWSSRADGDLQVIQARDDEVALTLKLSPEKLPVIHGADGVSRKGATAAEASHYYSSSRMHTEGTLTIRGAAIPVTGQSWMDHEFGSNQLGKTQIGWDWFSLQLADRSELMVYQIRRQDGSVEAASGGTWISPDGTSRHLTKESIQVDILDRWKSPRSGGVYPARWRLTVAPLGLSVEIRPTIPDQELLTHASTQVTYWEGSITVQGEREGKPISGVGYAELTGYATSLRGRL